MTLIIRHLNLQVWYLFAEVAISIVIRPGYKTRPLQVNWKSFRENTGTSLGILIDGCKISNRLMKMSIDANCLLRLVSAKN